MRGAETALLCAAAQQHGRNIILDLRGVDAIDAAGIGLLISLQAAGIYLRLMNATKRVREILRVTNLDSIFEICEAPSAGESTEGDATQPPNFIAVPQSISPTATWID